MEILLREDVENLGEMGEVVEVADGYARNYLLPRQMAVEVTDSNLEQVRREQEAREERQQQERERLESQADQLEGFVCLIEARATEKGQLYGSVTAGDVAEALVENGFEGLRASNIVMDKPIEELGDYDIELMLLPEVRVPITVRVVPPVDEYEDEEDEKE
ncbi:MAG: 50S ribosomal protein L9 [Planctomycetota bacterium]